jgi:seryl-tRNA synthetase
MSTKSKSFATQINDAQVMYAGLKSNIETLKKRGINDEFITSLDHILSNAIQQNNEQERLKAQLKIATATLDTSLSDLNNLMTEAVKVVKLDIPKEQ